MANRGVVRGADAQRDIEGEQLVAFGRTGCPRALRRGASAPGWTLRTGRPASVRRAARSPRPGAERSPCESSPGRERNSRQYEVCLDQYDR